MNEDRTSGIEMIVVMYPTRSPAYANAAEARITAYEAALPHCRTAGIPIDKVEFIGSPDQEKISFDTYFADLRSPK